MALRRRLKEVAATDDLTASQTSVLARLIKEGPASASELAGAERVRPQSTATIIGALETVRLIERSPDPDDGRRQVVTLTPQGCERARGVRTTRDDG